VVLGLLADVVLGSLDLLQAEDVYAVAVEPLFEAGSFSARKPRTSTHSLLVQCDHKCCVKSADTKTRRYGDGEQLSSTARPNRTYLP
jgi:hypothetical protein